MDPLIVQSYQIGIALGVLILSTLILFPGRKEEMVAPLNGDNDNTQPKAMNQKSLARSDYDADENCSIPQEPYWTPHRRLNTLTYLFILIVLCFVLLHSYTDPSAPYTQRQRQHPTTLLKMLFQTYFPKEASVIWKKKQKHSSV